MSVVKVIEIICEGASVEEALKNGLVEAAKTVQYINQMNVQHVEAIVKDNKIVIFRVNAKISFVVHN